MDDIVGDAGGGYLQCFFQPLHGWHLAVFFGNWKEMWFCEFLVVYFGYHPLLSIYLLSLMHSQLNGVDQVHTASATSHTHPKPMTSVLK